MRITIGEIVKAQGIAGEVKIKPYTDDLARFGRLSAVMVGGCPFKIRGVRERGGFVYMFFDGVVDRNAAEVLVGRTLEIDRSQAKKTENGEYFVVDLIGCDVYLSDGRLMGKLEYIDNFGSADVFTVRGDRTVRFPFLKRLGLVYDADSRTVTVDAEKFGEVCCYDD